MRGVRLQAVRSLAAQAAKGSPYYFKCFCSLELCCNRPSQSSISQESCHVKAVAFDDSHKLYVFIKRCVGQYIVVKPTMDITIAVLLMTTSNTTLKFVFDCLRLVNMASLLLSMSALTHMYSAILPRLRGLGGQKVFSLFVLIMFVMLLQELGTTILVLEAGLSTWLRTGTLKTVATMIVSVRLLACVCILVYTIFTTLFYRHFRPELFQVSAGGRC